MNRVDPDCGTTSTWVTRGLGPWRGDQALLRGGRVSAARLAWLYLKVGVQILLGGVIHTFVQPNMERLMDGVQQGTLDCALTKPADSQLLVSVRQFNIWQLVEVVSGLIVMVVGIGRLQGSLGLVDALAFVAALGIGAVLVYCFWLVITTGAFWIVRMEGWSTCSSSSRAPTRQAAGRSASTRAGSGSPSPFSCRSPSP